MVDLRQSENYGRYMEKIGWQVEKFIGGQAFVRKIPLLGNFVKILRPAKPIPPKLLDQIAHQRHAFAVQINYSPTKTLRLDLKPSLEEILQQMTKEARYEVRKAEKNGLRITIKNGAVGCHSEAEGRRISRECGQFSRTSREILHFVQNDSRSAQDDTALEQFVSLWQKNAWRRGFWLPFKKEIKSVYEAFGENAYLLLSYLSNLGDLDKKPLAGVLILVSGKTASYFHACSSPKGRKLSAPSLLVWETIKLAKSKGCQVFDFEGIYDERFPIKSWLGFTHFKKSFGGKEIIYPGSFTKYYNPFPFP